MAEYRGNEPKKARFRGPRHMGNLAERAIFGQACAQQERLSGQSGNYPRARYSIALRPLSAILAWC